MGNNTLENLSYVFVKIAKFFVKLAIFFADNLKNVGLIDDPFVFKFRAKIYKTNFTPNVYNLRTSMTIKNMLDIFDNPSGDDIVIQSATEDIYQLSPEDNEEVEVETE